MRVMLELKPEGQEELKAGEGKVGAGGAFQQVGRSREEKQVCINLKSHVDA